MNQADCLEAILMTFYRVLNMHQVRGPGQQIAYHMFSS